MTLNGKAFEYFICWYRCQSETGDAALPSETGHLVPLNRLHAGYKKMCDKEVQLCCIPWNNRKIKVFFGVFLRIHFTLSITPVSFCVLNLWALLYSVVRLNDEEKTFWSSFTLNYSGRQSRDSTHQMWKLGLTHSLFRQQTMMGERGFWCGNVYKSVYVHMLEQSHDDLNERALPLAGLT